MQRALLIITWCYRRKGHVLALEYLLNLGIEASRLSSTGLGEKNFVAINSNPDGTDNPGRQAIEPARRI